MRCPRFSLIRPAGLGLILFVALLAQPVKAQVGFGIIGGGNFSTLKSIQANGNLVSFDNATAYHAGAFLHIQLGPLGVRPSVLYLNTGALFNGASFLNQDDFDLSYISIPVDLIYTIGVGPLKPYIFAGPDFHLLNSNGAPAGLEESLETFVMNAGAGVGLALTLPGSSIKLYPQLRYSFGLSGLTDATYQVEGITIQADEEPKASMWLLSLGVGF